MSSPQSTEVPGGSELIELFQQGVELGASINALELQAQTQKAVVSLELSAYTEMPGLTAADYPQLADLSLGADFLIAKAEKERTRLLKLRQTAKSQFFDRAVLITPLEQGTTPITAIYYAGDGEHQRVIEKMGAFTRPHPESARGTVNEATLSLGQLLIKPRLLSLYGTNRGRFEIEVLDDNHDAAVKIEFPDAA